jgi:hypothetical protein
MVLIAPSEPSLWYECAGLHRAIGNLRAAIACLDQVMALAADEAAGQAAAAELKALRTALN